MPDNQKTNNKLRNIPSVNVVLQSPAVKKLIHMYGRNLVTYVVRTVITEIRKEILEKKTSPSPDEMLNRINRLITCITKESLKPIINATGIIIHTNLGRAPLGEPVVREIVKIISGYSNLEYDLSKASRGQRNTHCSRVLTYLTAADDVLVVNNNAAGIYLVLHSLAKGREVIISRGELIEIGGSFRIPEIMKASGVKMIEVGTTNKTRADDYKAAITDKTALLFKAHKSNFTISGFTEEASLKELADIAGSHNLPLVYDIGSGLLQKPEGISLEDEPDVKGSIKEGADLVTFSCDKLLGGPQAGVVAGRGDLISYLKHVPLMRVLRVGKMTLAALSVACRNYLEREKLTSDNAVFHFLNRNKEGLRKLALNLQKKCENLGVRTRVVPGSGRCGGGTLPELIINSAAVELIPLPKQNGKGVFADIVFKKLLQLERPVVGILREGKLCFDVLTLFEQDIDYTARAISDAVHSIAGGLD